LKIKLFFDKKAFLIMKVKVNLLLIIFFSLSVLPFKAQCQNSEGQDQYFWIAMPKAHFTAQKYGIQLNAYAARNRAFVGKLRSPQVQEIIKCSQQDTGFMVAAVSDKWHLIMGNRKNFVQAVRDTNKVRLYFEYVKKLFQNMSYYRRGIVNFEPDPFGSFSKVIRSQFGGDPARVYVPLDKVNMPEVKELNPPNNFAGFWQVVDYLRQKYAPQIMIAPTIKMWGIPVNIVKTPEPNGGWKADDPQVKQMWEYYARYGVHWDGLAFNFNGSHLTDDQYKKVVRYFVAVADGCSNYYHKPMYTFIWKVKIYAFHYKQPPQQWRVNELNFVFRNIPFLAAQGVRGMVIGYGNELNGLYVPKGTLPPALACWLKEYFLDKDFGCNPQGTIGMVRVKCDTKK
jgi:hypothetical protein